MMRQLAVVAALSALAVTTAGGVYVVTRAPQEAMTADIERDLRLAATAPAPRTAVVSAIEQGRPGSPSGQARGQRMVVPTKKRAPKAAPSPTVMEAPVANSAEVPETVPEPVTTEPVAVAATPTDASTSAAAAAPPDNSYPTPASGPSANSGNSNEGQRGSGDMGTGGGMRRGGVISAVAGAIIRGASARDHCEPGGGRRDGGINGGTLGTIGGILVGGNGAPPGTISSGPRGGRRW